jgi:glycosyltransferase involved in cell wall biosynthesis
VVGVTSTLSVVMPVFNEAPNLDAVLGQVVAAVLDRVPGSELVVVDDCSTDASPALLAAASAADRRITVLTNATNRGHGPSVQAGWAHGASEWILTLDSDGQVDLAAFDELWERRASADLVLGARTSRADPVHRVIVTACTRALASVVVRRRVADANTPFKLIHRSLFDHVAPAVPDDAFAPTVLLVVAAVRAGARVVEVPVRQLPRLHGRSTLHPRRLARALVQCTRETLAAARADIGPYHRPEGADGE